MIISGAARMAIIIQGGTPHGNGIVDFGAIVRYGVFQIWTSEGDTDRSFPWVTARPIRPHRHCFGDVPPILSSSVVYLFAERARGERMSDAADARPLRGEGCGFAMWSRPAGHPADDPAEQCNKPYAVEAETSGARSGAWRERVGPGGCSPPARCSGRCVGAEVLAGCPLRSPSVRQPGLKSAPAHRHPAIAMRNDPVATEVASGRADRYFGPETAREDRCLRFQRHTR